MRAYDSLYLQITEKTYTRCIIYSSSVQFSACGRATHRDTVSPHRVSQIWFLAVMHMAGRPLIMSVA